MLAQVRLDMVSAPPQSDIATIIGEKVNCETLLQKWQVNTFLRMKQKELSLL